MVCVFDFMICHAACDHLCPCSSFLDNCFFSCKDRASERDRPYQRKKKYPNVRTEPQSNIGHNRGKKSCSATSTYFQSFEFTTMTFWSQFGCKLSRKRQQEIEGLPMNHDKNLQWPVLESVFFADTNTATIFTPHPLSIWK